MNKVGKRLPYSEAPQYVDSLLEKCRLNAIAEAPRRKSRNVRRLWLTAASAAAVVAIVATVTLKLTLGGDSDTLAAITGAIAEAYYGVPDEIWEQAKVFMDDGGGLADTVERFYTLGGIIV